MNCRRVEKLIPLYVEGDLVSRSSDRVASHLESCGRCNWLADEYRESQSWLRSSGTPEFDEAFLGGFKAGVLGRIAQANSKPSLLASLMQKWSRRQVFALSAATLIVVGVVVFYIYKATTNEKRSVIEATTQMPEGDTVSPIEPRQPRDTGMAPEAGLKESRRAKNRGAIKARAAVPLIPVQAFEPLQPTQARAGEGSGPGVVDPSIERPGGGDNSSQMLRIEIQTSDPNIRIIWFAPKEVESPKSNY